MWKNIGYGLVFLLCGYLLGIFCPLKVLQPNVDWSKQISSGELFYYVICFFQCLGTLAAVVIALFNDSIKSHFRKPNLQVKLRSNEIMEELDSNINPNRKAKRYHNSIDIFNEGNENAEDCEITIEGIQFQGLGMQDPVNILQNSIELCWNGSSDQNKTYIPVQGKKYFQYIEIQPPSEQSIPGGASDKVPPRLLIGNYMVPSEYAGGRWTVTFLLSSPKSKPEKFNIIIDWDGSWENRQMEMKNKVKSKIEPFK